MSIAEAVRGIIAEFEHRMRRDGHGLRIVAENDAIALLTKGVDVPEKATTAERATAFAEAWQRIDAARVRAAAMIRVSLILTRVLRAIGGTPIFDVEAIPLTSRMAKLAMREQDEGEREPIALDKDKLKTEAQKHGLWKDESNEPQT